MAEADELIPSDGVKQYINKDVLTAAKERVHNILTHFDGVYVCFSGGKDSLATLELVDQCCKERGITKKIKVIFRDEEFIPDDVLTFVQEIYLSGRFDMKYYCLQQIAHKYIMGKKTTIVQWDAGRPHVREMPDYAIRDPLTVYDQYTVDRHCTDYSTGKICMILGIRAAESLTRLNAVKSVKVNTHIANTKNKNIWVGRPIYDWSEKDIFRFFYDFKIKYNPTYDHQMWNDQPLRVSSTISAEMGKRYDKLKTLYPVYFDQVAQLFPDLLLNMRYYKELDKDGIFDRYEHSFNGIFQYIEDHIEGNQKEVAKMRVVGCMTNRENRQRLDNSDVFGGFPVLYVFKKIVDGDFKRPIVLCINLQKKHYIYENLTPPNGNKEN